MRRVIRSCIQCGGRFTQPSKTGPRPVFCSSTCRNRARTEKVTQEIRDARKDRACSGCADDITQTTHPLATRCATCQASHRSTRRGKPKTRPQRLCGGCGKSISGMAKGKTVCADCGRPPRMCIDCGLADLRGTRRWRCDDCKSAWDTGESARMREWQQANPLKVQLWDRRSWAQKSGVPFDIDLSYLEKIWPQDNCCPVCGVAFTREHGSPANGSIDRIDNDHSVGYVQGNVQVVCVGCNGAKSDHTAEELAAGAAGAEWAAYEIVITTSPWDAEAFWSGLVAAHTAECPATPAALE